MNFLPLMLAASAVLPQAGPPPDNHSPLRNTFVVAVESVLDQASSLNINADAASFDPQMQTLKTSEKNLEALAGDEREDGVVAHVKDMLFDISSCRIQAIDGADISRCLLTIKNARTRTMDSIGQHKDGARWVAGRP